MSGSLTIRLLMCLYPRAWRARYAEELEALIVASSGGGRVPWQIGLDVAVAGVHERLRAAGMSGVGEPEERVRGGSLVVLCAWTMFVVAGTVVQKVSEHWQDGTPAASRDVPAGAFDALLIWAAIGSALVLAGVAAAIPSLLVFLRGGGWPSIRRRVATASLLTAIAVAATAGLALWANELSPAQRNGHGLGYGIGFVAWALICLTCLAAWTMAAVATARRLSIPTRTLKLESWLAAAVTLAMGAMTAATAVWWVSLANDAPWVLSGATVGSPGSGLAPALLAAVALMLIATLLGAVGVTRIFRSLPMLSGSESP